MTGTLAAPRTSPPGLVGRWGLAMARRRLLVVAVWVLLAAVCGAAYPALHARVAAPNYAVAGSDSEVIPHLVQRHFPSLGAEQDLVVFHAANRTADSPAFRAVIGRAMRAAAGTAGVVGAIGPFDGEASAQISADGHTAIGVVGLRGDMAQRATVAARLQRAVRAAGADGVQALATGYSPIENDQVEAETASTQRAESIGVPIALAVLVLALGALSAGALPLAVTGAGIALAAGALFGVAMLYAVDSIVVAVATMIGTGAGIDYAMFVVSRFNEELTRRGVRGRGERDAIAQAVGVALDTAGRTVLVSGVIVMISLCSMLVVGLPMLTGVSIGVVVAVLATLAAALTLLPAVLALLGPAVNLGRLPRRWRPAQVRDDAAESGWTRWARAVMARPLLCAGLGAAVLLAAAAPVLGIRSGLDIGLASLTGRPAGDAAVIVQRNFGVGMLAPIEVYAAGPGDTPLDAAGRGGVNQLVDDLGADPRVASVLPLSGAGRSLVLVDPKVSFDSAAAGDLVARIRVDATGIDGGRARVLVGGTTAEFLDVTHRIDARSPLVVALVLAISLVFLIAAFGSIVLAVKAIVMNLLATGAALGLTVAVFQHGWGESALRFHSPGFLQSFLPMTVFAVLFGLSMDYEVFLIRRMRESWERHGDNTRAVADGLRHTARPITAAAAIMVAVFGSFLTADILELKQIGFALAAAITIDAVLVRLVLVPALMRLFGRWNWWLPRVRTRTASPRSR